MGRATPNSKFPFKVWDGTTPSAPRLDIHAAPDADTGSRYRAEIQALEAVLIQYLGVLTLLKTPGPQNSILGVKDDGTDLEYKELLAGAGINILHGEGAITLEAADFASSKAITIDEVTVGTPLIMLPTGEVAKAQADALPRADFLGLSVSEASAMEECFYKTRGLITRSDWTTITGTADLTIGALYYLAADNPGFLTLTVPSTTGHLVVRAGRALSARSFDVEGQPSILL